MHSAELRPRDRLLRHGPVGLTDAELLAVLFRGGRSLEAAKGLLRDAGGLSELLATDRPALRRGGAGEGCVAVLLASGELLRRLTTDRPTDRPLLDQPAAVAGHVVVRYGGTGQEVLGVRLLDHVVVGAGGKWESLRRRGSW